MYYNGSVRYNTLSQYSQYHLGTILPVSTIITQCISCLIDLHTHIIIIDLVVSVSYCEI